MIEKDTRASIRFLLNTAGLVEAETHQLIKTFRF